MYPNPAVVPTLIIAKNPCQISDGDFFDREGFLMESSHQEFGGDSMRRETLRLFYGLHYISLEQSMENAILLDS